MTSDSGLFSAKTAQEDNFAFFTFAQAVVPGNYQTNDGRRLRVVAQEDYEQDERELLSTSAELILGDSSCICSYSFLSIAVELDAVIPRHEKVNFLVEVTAEDGRKLSRYVRSQPRESAELLLEIPSMSEIGGISAQSFCAEVSIVTPDGKVSNPMSLGCFNPNDYEPICHGEDLDNHVFAGGCSSTAPDNIPVVFIFALLLGAWRLSKRQALRLQRS